MISDAVTLKQLEALIWVAELGSFRKAATHLNTTQPNISARIATLEKTLEVRLMHRGGGQLRLTDRGVELLGQARSILNETERFLEIAARPDLIEDRLRLGVTEMVANTWIRTFLRRMKERYPGVAVELTVDLSRNLDKELTNKTLDLTIQNAPFGSSATGVIELGAFEFIWVAAPDVARTLGKIPSLEDLTTQPLLTHARHTQIYLDLEEKFSGRTGANARFVPSSSLTSCLHMALDGMGVATLPRAMVIDQLSAGDLVELAVGWTPSPLRFAARFQKDRAARFVENAAHLAAEVSSDFKAETDC